MNQMSTASGIRCLSILSIALATVACSREPSQTSAQPDPPPTAPAAAKPSATATSEPPRPQPETLAAARRGFVTQLHKRGPAPQAYRAERPPPAAQEVKYRSGDLKLKGWLSRHPPGSKRLPAVVYLHGGFAFSAADWADASPFVDAGFVLFMPMLRGENGNPGAYESFYGEVNDALAAGEYVKALPYVDGSNIFIVGHSVGGVLAVLTAMLPSVYKVAASLSGYLDMGRFVAGSTGRFLPYDTSRDEEIRLRNPHEFISSLQIPIILYADEANFESVWKFSFNVNNMGKQRELVRVPGDHATMVKPSVQDAIERFLGYSQQ